MIDRCKKNEIKHSTTKQAWPQARGLVLPLAWGRVWEKGNSPSPTPPFPPPGATLTYFNDGGVQRIFLGLTFWPKGIFLGL